MRKVLDKKRIELWTALLKQEECDDMGVVNIMREGVKLVGVSEQPPCFEPKVKPCSLTEAQLRESVVWRRKALAAKPLLMSSEFYPPLEAACQEEVGLGFTEGPFDENQVSAHLGHSEWSCVRRFIIQQSEKYRPIDDCAECQQNEGFCSTYKLQDADYLSRISLEVGKRIKALNPPSHLLSWKGKCVGLKKAYKQLAVCPKHRDVAVCVTRSQDGKVHYHVPNSLMFESNAAVYDFTRVSRSIWYLLSRILILPASHFFDDYPALVPECDSSEIDTMISELLHLLGWDHQLTGEGQKGKSFGHMFDVLGMRLDLSNVRSGEVTLSNKPSRTQKICEFVESIEKEGSLSRRQAQILMGYLNFARGFFQVRSLRFLCRDLVGVIWQSAACISVAFPSRGGERHLD